MKYKHLFFDLDHTLWDFDANSRLTLHELYHSFELEKKGVTDFDLFHRIYLENNDKLWARYRNGLIKVDELRWKRMWLTLIEFKIGDEPLARSMGEQFMNLLPSRNVLFPDTIETLQFLTDKNYKLHLITNGFEATQHHKLKNSGLDKFFIEVITSEGSNSLKPHKEIFQYAFQKTRSLSHESIMIGDSIEADIQGAINAGIDQVYVNHLNIPSTTIQPTYTVYALKELEKIF
jgi:putative hydrolase of the HAD superfamily